MDSQLRAQVERATRTSLGSAPVLKLAGQASSRMYFRVGTPPESWVVMVMPVDAAKKSDEASKGPAPTELPFVNVHRYLDGLGVRVPKIHHYDEPAGMMVIEDLTDETFEMALGKTDRAKLYTQAVQLLGKLRVQAEEKPDPSFLAFNRAFNADLYDRERHHFRQGAAEAGGGQLGGVGHYRHGGWADRTLRCVRS